MLLRAGLCPERIQMFATIGNRRSILRFVDVYGIENVPDTRRCRPR